MQATVKFSGTLAEFQEFASGYNAESTITCEVQVKFEETARYIKLCAPFLTQPNGKLHASKQWRKLTGCGLADAIAAIEKHFPETVHRG